MTLENVYIPNLVAKKTSKGIIDYIKNEIVKSGGISGSGGLEIGDIGITVFPIDENQLKRRYLNGQTILIEQYQSFTEKLKNAIQQYPSLSCSESEWQEIASNSDVGQCGKFVLDEDAGTIRLPKIIMPIQGLIDLSSLGEIVNSGLPNIEAGDRNNYILASSSHSSNYNNKSLKIIGTTSYYAYTTGGAPRRASFDASLSNSIYGNSETVQPEQIQYPYFIQVATGVEETVPAEKELTLNNPYSLLEHKIVDCKLNNLSWLRSEGQFNSGDTYSDAYNLLLSEKTTPTRDFSIKTSDEAYTDYDFVLNTTDKTFRLPLFTSERQLVEKKEPTDDDPTWYNLYSDGWFACGYSDEKPSSASNLYYYIGDTVQNASLINAGRIEEKFIDLIPSNSELITNYCIPDYTAEIENTETEFQAPTNGLFICHALSAGMDNNITVNGSRVSWLSSSPSNFVGVDLQLFLKKGDIVNVINKPNNQFYSKFYPLMGVNQNA